MRIFQHRREPTSIDVGQTQSELPVSARYEAAFALPDPRAGRRCIDQARRMQRLDDDVTAPTAARATSSIFGTGSTLVDLFWNNGDR